MSGVALRSYFEYWGQVWTYSVTSRKLEQDRRQLSIVFCLWIQATKDSRRRVDRFGGFVDIVAYHMSGVALRSYFEYWGQVWTYSVTSRKLEQARDDAQAHANRECKQVQEKVEAK